MGEVKKLRVFAYEYTYVNSESDHIAQGIQSGWDIKRNLGEVDVEPDGSAMFKIPANTPVSFQPLDSEWMRSWVTGMPGEVLSCVGCHEDQNSMPVAKRAMASGKAPSALQTPEGGVRSFTFDLEIQPILDRNCIVCHNAGGVKPDFSAKQVVNSEEESAGTYSRTARKAQSGSLYLSQSYLNLHPYVNRQGPEADIYVMNPYEYHASTSELVRLLKAGHHGVELTDKEWRTIYNWIDFNAPCHGRFVYNRVGYCPTDQYSRRIELANKYANGAGVDWKKELDDYAKWMAENGITTAVLKYRLPNTTPQVPMEDAAEALRYMKEEYRGKESIKQLGIMGFSAGGHLAASTAVGVLKANGDESARAAIRPDFAVLFYPVITGNPSQMHKGSYDKLLGSNRTQELTDKWSPELVAGKDAPQTLLILSSDDATVPPINSTKFYNTLKELGVPASITILPSGGHGWGFRDSFKYKAIWQEAMLQWLENIRK